MRGAALGLNCSGDWWWARRLRGDRGWLAEDEDVVREAEGRRGVVVMLRFQSERYVAVPPAIERVYKILLAGWDLVWLSPG